jgi:hypothetical protein
MPSPSPGHAPSLLLKSCRPAAIASRIFPAASVYRILLTNCPSLQAALPLRVSASCPLRVPPPRPSHRRRGQTPPPPPGNPPTMLLNSQSLAAIASRIFLACSLSLHHILSPSCLPELPSMHLTEAQRHRTSTHLAPWLLAQPPSLA